MDGILEDAYDFVKELIFYKEYSIMELLIIDISLIL